MEVMELTKRGRTSTISSGTRKIRAFNFLAIEIASFAVKTRTHESAPDISVNYKGVNLPFCFRSSYSLVSLTLRTSVGSTIPGRSASRRSRKKIPVVSDGSLNDLMGRTPGLPFCAVVFAHLRISVSLIGRPWLALDSELSVCVMFLLERHEYCSLIKWREGAMTHRISCHTRPRTRVFWPSTISAP